MENGQEPYIETQNFPLREPTNELAEILESKGYKVTNSTILDGQHSMYQWRCTMAEAETAIHPRKSSFLELQAAYQPQKTIEEKTTVNRSASEIAEPPYEIINSNDTPSTSTKKPTLKS